MDIEARRFVYDKGWMEVAPAVSSVPLPVYLTGEPGFYSCFGAAFDCREQGLYLFCNPVQPCAAQYRLLAHPLGHPDFDLMMILEGIAEWCVCGDYDYLDGAGNPTDINVVYSAALHRQPVINCGPTCIFTKTLLAQRGVGNTRLCRVNMSGPINPWQSYGDVGHVLLEVNDGNGWIVYDMLSDRYWGMSFGDLMDAIQNHWPHAEFFGDAKESPINRTERSAYFKCFLGGVETPSRQAEWDQRIFGIPFIDSPSGSIGYIPPGKSCQVPLPPDYTIISQADWLNTFYP